MKIAKEEVFGPLLTLHEIDSVDEAISHWRRETVRKWPRPLAARV